MNRRLALAVAFLLCTHVSFAGPMIFLVRHAEKAGGDAKDPDLSRAGTERAEWLAATLKDANITAIYATEFKRTQQTAEPLARATHVSVTNVPANDTTALVSGLKDAKGNVLVVAHSNTIPAILKALGVTAAVTLGENDYNDLFIITLGAEAAFARVHLPMQSDD